MASSSPDSVKQPSGDNVDTQEIVVQKKWRWLPLSHMRYQRQQSQGWSPLQCMPAMSDILRLAARKKEREPRAVLSGNDRKHREEPFKLDVDFCNAVVTDNLAAQQEQEVDVHIKQTSEAPQVCKEDEHFPEPIANSSNVDTTPFAEASEASDEVLDSVVLDVGFAEVELKKVQTWPKYEFYILAKDGFITKEGGVALLEYLDFVLLLPDVMSTGFVLTYDLRHCACPQLDLVSWIMHYISDPDREEAWDERCVCWKVVVPAGIYFKMAQSVLSFLFNASPPKCRVFLLTDLDMTGLSADDWVCYKPEDMVQEEASMLSAISTGFLDTFFPAYPHKLPTRERASSSACQQESDAEAPKVDAVAVGRTCADFCSTPFATISQGFEEARGKGYLKVVGHDAPMTDDGLQQIMDFMDDFVDSPIAQNGYGIIYDLRHLNVPSMNMLMRVAEWGSKSDRQGKWTRLNTSCKIIVSPGLKFSMCRAVLKSFFYMCPPVCETFLLTDPDEPEDTATMFVPRDGPSQQAEVSCQAHSDKKPEPEPEAASDDGGSISGHSAAASETTSASAASAEGNAPKAEASDTDEQRDDRHEQLKVGSEYDVDACRAGDLGPSRETSFQYVLI